MKDYCSVCKNIDVEVGLIWHFKLTGANFIHAKEDQNTEPLKPNRKRGVRLFATDDFGICDGCWMKFLDFINPPKEESATMIA